MCGPTSWDSADSNARPQSQEAKRPKEEEVTLGCVEGLLHSEHWRMHGSCEPICSGDGTCQPAGWCIVSAAKDLKKKKKERKDSRSQATLGHPLKLQLVVSKNCQDSCWVFLDMGCNTNQAKNGCILKGDHDRRCFPFLREPAIHGQPVPGQDIEGFGGFTTFFFFSIFFHVFHTQVLHFLGGFQPFHPWQSMAGHRKRRLPKKRTRFPAPLGWEMLRVNSYNFG